MRGALAGCVVALGALLSAAGCGEKPDEAFGELKTAALAGDAKVIWGRITADSRDALGAQAVRYLRRVGPAAEAEAAGADGREAYEYLESLTVGLDGEVIEYIRSLRVAGVEIEGDTARVELKAFRFEPPEEPLVFRKVDGRWLWDARETLDTYLEYRGHGFRGGM